MLGHKLCEYLPERFEVFGVARRPVLELEPYRCFKNTRLVGGLDCTEPGALIPLIKALKPAFVINAVGLVKQAAKADDQRENERINTGLPRMLAILAGEHSFRLVHISTDCVFDGSRGGYREDDPISAKDSYGRTKASGEVYGEGCLTLRTSIIGKELFHRQGLLEWFIGKRGQTVQGFNKAFFSGLTTQAFSRLLLTILTEYPELEGLFHVSSDRISKYDLLTKVNERLGLNVEIIPDETVDIDRSLDSSLFRSVTQLPIPSWDAMISELRNDSAKYD